MKILLISPLGFPINENTKYTGIEKLVWQYSQELVKEHDITVIGHADSKFPEKVKNLSTQVSSPDILNELRAYQSYSHLYHKFDIIHDFSHLHLAARFNKLPTLNVFWHAPALVKFPKAPYNIIALSHWAAREFKRIYNQEARYQETIVIDPKEYHPEGERDDRFLTIGRMAPEKGNLEALILCQKANVPLDVVGGRGAEKIGNEPLTEYEIATLQRAQKPPNQFYGEVADEVKISLMKKCKALIYATNHPEVTSHKIQEAMFCGAPVIVPRLGGIPEIVTNGMDGFLCQTEPEYLEAIKNVDKLEPEKTRGALVLKYALNNVVANYIPLYERVANGERW